MHDVTVTEATHRMVEESKARLRRFAEAMAAIRGITVEQLKVESGIEADAF